MKDVQQNKENRVCLQAIICSIKVNGNSFMFK